jgi:hypothetical protein
MPSRTSVGQADGEADEADGEAKPKPVRLPEWCSGLAYTS